jgi:hypothetical protein
MLVVYTKEKGKLELTYEEWNRRDPYSITLHREDGPAVERADGTKEWYLNGRHYRENGPTVELPNGTKVWYMNNKLHRIDGPARKFFNGGKEWWIDGKEYSEEEFYEVIQEVKSLPLELKLTDPRWWVREMK